MANFKWRKGTIDINKLKNDDLVLFQTGDGVFSVWKYYTENNMFYINEEFKHLGIKLKEFDVIKRWAVIPVDNS